MTTDEIVRDGLSMLPPEYLALSATFIGMLSNCHPNDIGVPEIMVHLNVTSLDNDGEYLVTGTCKDSDSGTVKKK